MNDSNKHTQMNGETAMAFAGHQFEQLHPRDTCPEWLGRCTSIGYNKDGKGRFIVSFAVTPQSTNDAIIYFQVAVDAVTANTQVLLDRELSSFSGEDLQGY